MVNYTKGQKTFNILNIAFMIVLGFIMLYPLWYVAICSISDPQIVSSGGIIMFPKGFALSSYKQVFATKNIWTAYSNTVLYAVVGTAMSMVATILGAYPLSKKHLKGRKVIIFVIMFTMWFNPGMMAFFINFKNLNLLDTRLGVLLAFMVSTFYVILMRTFFESIPESLDESAKIDGANDFTILWKIYIPLSVPALATISLYYFVGRWNSFFWPMLLVTDQSKVPLQVLLRKLIVQVSYSAEAASGIDMVTTTEETIVFATIMVAIVPMLVLYPFIQRFFIKGIMVGAVKG